MNWGLWTVEASPKIHVMLIIHVINFFPLWNPTWMVGHQNCARSGRLRIFRGPELDQLPSAVMLTGFKQALLIWLQCQNSELFIKSLHWQDGNEVFLYPMLIRPSKKWKRSSNKNLSYFETRFVCDPKIAWFFIGKASMWGWWV